MFESYLFRFSRNFACHRILCAFVFFVNIFSRTIGHPGNVFPATSDQRPATIEFPVHDVTKPYAIQQEARQSKTNLGNGGIVSHAGKTAHCTRLNRGTLKVDTTYMRMRCRARRILSHVALPGSVPVAVVRRRS